jgi:membrane-bound metal-dependent hydrolase YbcI (DUF457 family)
MNSVGVFIAWDFLFVLLITVAYYYSPKRFIEKKNDYVKFSLSFLSVYFLLFIVLTNIINDRGITHTIFGIAFVPALYVYHLLFPFKTVKRNQHLNFFLFFIALYVGIIGSILTYVGLFVKM